jgi:predicted NUDIX family phosphoesterase
VESLGAFQGVTFDVERYRARLLEDPRSHRFVPRHQAEQDESLKQLIPYFVICHGEAVWCYTRGKQSGEDRLVAKVSLGIGGHINTADTNLFGYTWAAERELKEEVCVPEGCEDRVVALLNDDSTPVGRVHLGVIHVLRCATADVRKREKLITEAGFRTPAELQALRGRMETWSQICLDNLPELLRRGPRADLGVGGV